MSKMTQTVNNGKLYIACAQFRWTDGAQSRPSQTEHQYWVTLQNPLITFTDVVHWSNAKPADS